MAALINIICDELFLTRYQQGSIEFYSQCTLNAQWNYLAFEGCSHLSFCHIIFCWTKQESQYFLSFVAGI